MEAATFQSVTDNANRLEMHNRITSNSPTLLQDSPNGISPYTLKQDERYSAEYNSPLILVRSKIRLATIIAALFISLFVSALDTTIIATAIPIITNDLHSAAGYTWIGGAYTLAGAVSKPIWTKISDIWGRKIIMLFALILFFISSTVCATAQTMTALIVGRSSQGLASGGLMLLVYVVLADLFDIRRRSLFMGLAGGIWAVAGGVGPVLGGAFATLASWRWCFWINLPLCGISFVLLLFCLDMKHDYTSFKDGMKAIDWFGIITFLAFSLMVLLGLNFGGVELPWDSAKIIVLLVVGLCMIGVFIYTQKKIAKFPLMPLHVFQGQSNIAALLVGFFHGMIYIGAEYYMPLYFQAVKRQSALMSGVLIIPMTIAAALTDVLSGIVLHRSGGRYREVIQMGTVLMCLGAGLLIILDVNTSLGEAIGLQIVLGCGYGLLFTPTVIAIQNRTEQKHVATATSTFSFVRSMAISISIILGGVVFQNSMDTQQEHLSNSNLGLSSNVLARLGGKEVAANVGLPGSLTNPMQRMAVLKAFAWSMRNMWIMYTAFAGLALLCSLWVCHGNLETEHTETVTGIKSVVKTDTNVTT